MHTDVQGLYESEKTEKPTLRAPKKVCQGSFRDRSAMKIHKLTMCKVNMLSKKCFTNHKQSPHRLPGTIWVRKNRESHTASTKKGLSREFSRPVGHEIHKLTMYKVKMLSKKIFYQPQTKSAPCTPTPRDYMSRKKQRSPHCEHQKRFGAEFNLMLCQSSMHMCKTQLNICATKVFDDLQ